MMTETRIEIGCIVEREMNPFIYHYGRVVEIGTGSNAGRVRVKWQEMIYTPVKWDGVYRRNRINNIPTGEPPVTRPMDGRRTWINTESLRVVT